ncbi:MAG: Ig-like domain-containing protein, partial [Bacteroidales bacterium]|nr:Ig-like domain-containing protein [Bacteroidales bacterium]
MTRHILFQSALTLLLALGVAAGKKDGAEPAVVVTGVTLNKTTLSLAVSGSETLTATVAPENATNKTVNWTTSNTAVATVNASGLVTTVSAGTATITITTQDGNKTATCTVTVTGAGSATNKTYTTNGVSFEMIGVEGGTFNMGDATITYATPVHSVTLSDFSIGQTEVTQALWLAVMGAHDETQDDGSGNNYPEYYVSWNDIVGTGATTGYTV